MQTRAERGKISGAQLTCILVVSRVAVTLTYYKSIITGRVAADTLLSLFIAYGLTLLFAMPAYLCIKNNKNPLKIKAVAMLYSLLFSYYAAVNISRFAYFSSSTVQGENPMLFVILLITAAACYCAVLGIEGTGRFSALCLAILLGVILLSVLSNIKNIELINYFPSFQNSKADVLKNSLLYASNSVEAVIVAALDGRVNGKIKKPLFAGITVSYLLIFIFMLACVGVLGNAASLYAYPGYTLFQMASLGAFSRFDAVHTAFWVFSLFLKTSVFIGCAALLIKRFSHTSKCLFFSALSSLAAIGVNRLTLGSSLTENGCEISMTLCTVFVIAIPLLSLIFNRKKEGEYEKNS